MEGAIISARTKTVLLGLTTVLLIYTLLGFFAIPAILKNQLPKIADDKLNRVALIKDVDFNPFSMELNLHAFDLKNLDKSSFFSFERLNVNVAVLKSITDLTLTVDQIILDKPNAFIQRDGAGKFNFTDLLEGEKNSKEEKTDETLFPITIIKTAINEGKLNWEDDFYTHQQKETVYPINLNLSQFTTKVNKQSQMEIALALASGGELDWKGNLELTPLSSIGQIKLDKVNFQKVWKLFLQDNVNFEILEGTEEIEVAYELTDTEKGLQFLIKNAHIDINGLKISEKGKTESVINIPNFKVSGIDVDLLNKNIIVNKVSASDAQFKAWLDSEGIINYQPLFSSNVEEANTQQNIKKAEVKEEPWSVTLNTLDLSQFSFNFVDNSLLEPAKIDLTSLKLSGTELSNKPGAKLPFKLGVTINKNGALNIGGSAVLAPFSSQLQVNANNIALNDFQSYISPVLRLDLISGLFNVNAKVALSQEEGKPFGLVFKGNSHIENFVTRDQISNKDFLKWTMLSLNEIDLNLAKNSYFIDSVKIKKPYTRVLIRKDKSMNISDVVVSKNKEEDKPEKKKPSSDSKEVKTIFKIANFDIVDGISDFSDKSLILPFAAHISKLKGSIKGISSDQDANIKIALDGRVANLAPVNIKGNISPNQGNSEIDLDFKSMPLPLMTPYMAEFAGRKIEKGNMSLGLKYKIRNKKLTATNNLLIEQLVLGDNVENPEAVSLPLDLAIALLEDSNGKIKLDMPITGSLDDPQFSVAGLVVDTLVNVLTKVISSPFNAIASLVGSEEDISKITFLPGESTLDDKQKEKLNGLATALAERPALKLEIKGAAFSKEDWPLLQAEALDTQLLKMRADELSKNGKKTVLPEHLKFSKEENQRLLADLFIQKFPTLGEKSLFGTPQLIDSTQGDFYEIAQSKMAALIEPNTQRLEKLAVTRAQAIAKYLSEKQIAIDRVYLLNVVVDPKGSENLIATNLNLTVH